MMSAHDEQLEKDVQAYCNEREEVETYLQCDDCGDILEESNLCKTLDGGRYCALCDCTDTGMTTLQKVEWLQGKTDATGRVL